MKSYFTQYVESAVATAAQVASLPHIAASRKRRRRSSIIVGDAGGRIANPPQVANLPTNLSTNGVGARRNSLHLAHGISDRRCER